MNDDTTKLLLLGLKIRVMELQVQSKIHGLPDDFTYMINEIDSYIEYPEKEEMLKLKEEVERKRIALNIPKLSERKIKDTDKVSSAVIFFTATNLINAVVNVENLKAKIDRNGDRLIKCFDDARVATNYAKSLNAEKVKEFFELEDMMLWQEEESRQEND